MSCLHCCISNLRKKCYQYYIKCCSFSEKISDDFPAAYYTYDSKIDGKVYLTFVAFRDDLKLERSRVRIRDKCTVFKAKLLSLNFPIEWIT